MDFVRDFFFTDIANHVEFLKWTQTLDKGDDVLLIGILERLVSPEPPTPVVPFYGSVRDQVPLHKNPLNVAKGYAQMQNLHEHDYNIFEYAYLSSKSSWQTRAAAYVAAAIQLSFLGVLVSYNIFEARVYISPDEEYFDEVVVVMLVSTALFAATVRSQFMSSAEFVSTMRELSDTKGRKAFLFLDVLINQVVGVCVFFFNIYFILVSDTPTDAVLNSVALAFIIEIDDYFKPNWNDDRVEDATAIVLRDYITESWDTEELVVGRQGPPICADSDKFYVEIPDALTPDGSFCVAVYAASKKDPSSNVTTSYDRTCYNVIGLRAHEFHEAIRQFHCLENFEDILQ